MKKKQNMVSSSDSNTMKRKSRLRQKNIVAALIVILMTTIVMLSAYFRISYTTEQRCYDRISEIVDSLTYDVSSKLVRDSLILNSLAEVITIETDNSGNYDYEALNVIMGEYDTLTPTTSVNLLLPGDILITGSNEPIEVSGKLSFGEQAAKGEYISEKMPNVMDQNRMVIRHFVPIIRNGETIAMLYSSTDLERLPSALNYESAYHGEVDVYLVDQNTGDFLMDTLHESLGNLRDFSIQKVRGKQSVDSLKTDILNGGTNYFIFYSSTEQKYLYFYYEPMATNNDSLDTSSLGTNWTICISVPEQECFANLFRVQHTGMAMIIAEVIIMVVYLMWTLHNTTETLEKAVLEERLIKAENAEHAKTMFLSNMSHDIRTPMNAIIGYTTLAATNIDNKERMQDYLSKILSSSNHLLSLINDVLDMSRIESGRVYIDETECSLPEMLHDLRNILQSQIQAKQLNFFIDTIDVIDEDVFCDKLHMNQVLLNLLGNAIKFTPAGGTVSLIFRQKHGAPEGYAAYEIRVKDTGIGMSPEFVKHVFEPFEREANSTISGIQGTGLGMAIAKNIVDMMGGTIEVNSEQGKGTEYILSLEFRLQSERKQVEVIKELEGLRALVVDDDYNICDSVSKMLVQLGMRADWTMSGKEAILHAGHAYELGDAFSAYIIDWQLPDLNGIEIVRRIRAKIGDSTPIIILTAYDWTSIEKEAREAGVTAFVNKPIFVSTLRDTLLHAIGKADAVVESVILPETDEEMHGKRILLVEDNELNREIANEILTESGFVVECAENGAIAVDKVKHSEVGYYDLILMDVLMPVMNGYEATKAIRAFDNPGLSKIPIIAMTANAFNEDKAEALAAGMNDHTAKPIDVDKLFEVIKKYVGQKSAES